MLTKEQVEFYLNRGDNLGFTIEPKNKNCIGWLDIEKLQFNERFYNLMMEESSTYEYAKRELNKKDNPYIMAIRELPKEIYEDKSFESNADFELDESYRFSTLDEVEEFLKTYNLKLEEIKWMADVPHVY